MCIALASGQRVSVCCRQRGLATGRCHTVDPLSLSHTCTTYTHYAFSNTITYTTHRQTYFYGLVAVGTLWLSLRIIWAINTVNLGYDADLGPQPPLGPGGNDNNNGTDSGGGGGGADDGQVEPSRSELIYMVSLSVMIYTMVWGLCFLRASQFFNLLRRANRLGP